MSLRILPHPVDLRIIFSSRAGHLLRVNLVVMAKKLSSKLSRAIRSALKRFQQWKPIRSRNAVVPEDVVVPEAVPTVSKVHRVISVTLVTVGGLSFVAGICTLPLFGCGIILILAGCGVLAIEIAHSVCVYR